jgi:hypothetical protein
MIGGRMWGMNSHQQIRSKKMGMEKAYSKRKGGIGNSFSAVGQVGMGPGKWWKFKQRKMNGKFKNIRIEIESKDAIDNKSFHC